MITLTQHQSDQISRIKLALDGGAREVSLTGEAGTGKTTVMKEMIHLLKLSGTGVTLAAPTGRAARQLERATLKEAATIHALLYGWPSEVVGDDGKKKLVWNRPKAPCADGDLLIVDESSMVSHKIAADIRAVLPRSSKILWIGDKYQLKPVEGTWGVDLDNATAELTEVLRQSEDSDVLNIARAIRRNQPTSIPRNKWKSAKFRRWLKDGSGQALAWTHRVRKQINAFARNGVTEQLVAGDRLVVTSNCWKAGLLNGDLIDVTAPKKRKDAQDLWELSDGRLVIFGDLTWTAKKRLEAKIGKPIANVDYGFCITIHKAQGSEWDDVVLCVDQQFLRLRGYDPAEYARLGYTAVTRAKYGISARMVK